MKARDVFTPGTFPTVTFVDDPIKDKQKLLKDALEVGSMLISISGPSKSGKTVFVENIVGREKMLHVTGAGVDSPRKLWERVFDLIGTPLASQQSSEKSFQGSLSGKMGGDVGLIVKGKGEIGASGAWSSKNSESESFSHDHLQLLIRELSGTNYVVFIDDFHYISRDAQIDLAKQIKEAIRNNICIICASVPYHSDDVIRANSDLRGRIFTIDLDYWDPSALIKIAHKGFSELKIDYTDDFLDKISKESAGSPQLMQAICLNACFELDVREACGSIIKMPSNQSFFQRVCTRTAMMADYSSIVEKMKEGPKTRGTERNQYILHDGTQNDVYPIVLRAISSNPAELTFRYSNLVERINHLCGESGPSGSSVIGACYHLSNIANDSANQTIVEWDADNDVLDIRDPYLLFYLRWSEFLDRDEQQ